MPDRIDPVPAEGRRGSRVRSPAYPAISLPRAIEYASLYYNEEHQHFAAPRVVANHLGFSDEKNGSSSTVLSALRKFGLLEEKDNKLGLTSRALDIVVSSLPDDVRRMKAVREAALAPAIYREIWEGSGGQLPSDLSIEYQLERDRGFNPKAIRGFIQDFRATLEFAGLLEQDDSPAPNDIDSLAPETEGVRARVPRVVANAGSLGEVSPQKRSGVQSGMRQDVFTLDEGQALIQWPETLSQDSFEDFKSWLDLVIRKAKRSVSDIQVGKREDNEA